MVQEVSIYGTYMAQLPMKRVWVTRKDKIRQRYWQATKKGELVEGEGRYDFSGTSYMLYKAIRLAHHYMPKGNIRVSAKAFVENPEQYGYEGKWIDRTVES